MLGAAIFLGFGAPLAASWSETFSAYSVESDPSGWYDTSIGAPAPEAPGLFKVWADPHDPGNRVYGTHSSSGLPGTGESGHPSPRTGIFSHYTPLTFAAGQGFTYTGRFWREKSTSYIGMTFFSSYPGTDRYYLLGLADAGAASGGRGKPESSGPLVAALSAFGAGPLTGLAISAFSPEAGAWHRFVVQVDPGTGGLSIRAKVWPDGTPEPADWLLDAVDPSAQPLTSGAVGVWSSSKGRKYWDDLTVTEGGSDTNAPIIAITVNGAPLQNGQCFRTAVAPLIIADDASPVTLTAVLNDADYMPGTSIIEQGQYRLVVTAVDAAGNTAGEERNFTLDWSGAPVTMLHPPAGTCLAAGALTLSGSCGDCVSITANAVAGQVAEGAFLISGLPLVEGINPLTLATADACGNLLPATFAFSLDTVAPVVVIAQPPAGFVTIQERITLSGSIIESNLVSAALNNSGLEVAGGAFSAADLPLAAGPNTFTVSALDCAGHAGQDSATVVRDVQDPVIAVREGYSGAAPIVSDPPYNHAVIPTIEVQDDTGTTVTAELDGQVFSSGTAVTEQGPHQLHVTATDQAGRQTVLDAAFSIDTTAPSVAVVSPSPFQIQTTAAIILTVDADDAEQVVVNDVQAVAGGGLFTAALTLTAEGENPVHIEAFDRAGNRGVADVVYTLDSLPPRIVIHAPTPGFLTNKPSVDMEGSIENEPHPAGVTVNGLPAVVSGADFARAAVPLAEGAAVVTVTAADTLGHQATATVEGTVDLTPPQAILLANGSPLADGALFNVTVVLTAQATDVLTGATASIQVNAQPYGEQTPLVSEGIYQVRLTASDGAGNTAVVERSFTIDKTPPALTGLLPAAGCCVAAAAVSLGGQCGDAESVSVNGTAAQVNGGAFVFDVVLQEGSNTLSLRAEDAAGNASIATHTLILDSAAPVLTLTAPADGALTTASSVVVTGTAADTHLKRVLINGAEAPLSGNAFQSLPVALPEGETLIAVEAFDCAGNTSGTQSVKVIRDTQCPVLTIGSPRPNETVGSASLNVTGSVADDHLKEVKIGAVTAVLGQDTYTAAVTLQAGANTLRVEAADTLGNLCAQEVVVTYDASAPSIAITSPAANALITTLSITVTGTVADDNLKEYGVTVNGLSAVVADGTFTRADVALTEGSNTLIARATDTFDHSATATVTVTLDTRPPTVQGTQPANAAAGVPLDYLLKVTFSEILDWATVMSQSFVLAPAVAGTLSHSGTVLTFRPSASLQPDTAYTVQLTAGIKDKAGLALTPHTFTFTTQDTLAPQSPSLGPVPSTVCQNPITVSGTAEPGALITLTGGQSAVTGTADASGAFALPVRLREETLNLLEARARDAAGNTSAPAAAEVVHSCAAPEVTEAVLDTAAAAIRVVFNKPMDAATLTIARPPAADPAATCLVLDPDGVPLDVTGTWDGTGSLLTLALPHPQWAQAVLTLKITAGMKDRLGIPLAWPFMKMFNTAYDAFLSGMVFDDTTGLPLPGAVVTPAGFGASGPSTASNGEGKYTLALPQTPVGSSEFLLFAKEGATTVWRRDVAVSRRETLVFDARLTPRSAPFTIPAAGVTDHDLGSGTMITVASSAFAAPVEAQITLLSPQGLPNLLPLGWSPLFGLEVLLTVAPETGGVLTVTRREAEPLDIARLYLAEYSTADHQWRAVAEAALTDPASPSAALPGAGLYAFIYPDTGATAPGDVTLSAPLPGAATQAEPLALTAEMTLDPETVLPTQTARCAVGSVAEAQGRPIPSSYPVTARVQETLTLIGGSSLAVPPYTASLLLYKAPVADAGGEFPPVLVFPVTPTPTAREVVLDVGYDHVSLFPFPTEVRRGDSIGPAGGGCTGPDGLTVTIPAGATGDYVPVSIESAPESALSTPLPADLRFLTAAQVSFGTFELTKSALLSAPFPAPLGEREFPVLLTLDKQADGTFVVFRAAAEQIGGALESCEVYPSTVLSDPPGHPYTPCSGAHVSNDLPLPILGVRRSGLYVFAALLVPQELNPGLHLLSGKVEDRTVPPVSGAYPAMPDQFIRSLTSPLHALTDENGEYGLAVPLQDALLSTVKRSTGDAVRQAVDVLESQPRIYTGVDLAIQSVPPTIVSFAPAEGATGVPLTPVIEVNFSEPIAPSSVGADAIVLKMGSAPITGTVALAASGLKLAFTPANPLLEATAYTYTVSGALKDLAGNPLAGPNPATLFTTVDLILPQDIRRELIRLTFDPENGLADVVGAAGAVPSGALLAIEHIGSGDDTTITGNAWVDGSFDFHAGSVAPFPCALQDRIILHVYRSDQAAVTLELTPFERPDGRGAWLDDRAAEFTTTDGITVTVAAGTFDQIVPIMVAPVELSSVPFTPSLDYPALGAFDFDIGGAFARKPVHINLPRPAGSETVQEFFAATVERVAGEDRLMVAARLYPAADGKLTTVFPAGNPGLRSAEGAADCENCQVDKTCYEQCVLPILRQTRRIILLGAGSASQYIVGPYPGFGKFIEDPLSKMVSYFDAQYSDAWQEAMGNLRFLLLTPLGRNIQINVRDVDTGYLYYRQNLPPGDAGVYEFDDPLPVTDEIPLPVESNPFLLVPFNADSLYLVEQFGFTAALAPAEGAFTLSINAELGEDQFLTVCRTESGTGAQCRNLPPYTFAEVDRDTPFLLALTRGRLDPLPRVLLDFNMAIQPLALRRPSGCEAAAFSFRPAGSLDPAAATAATFTNLEETGDCVFPQDSQIGLSPVRPLKAGQTYELVINSGISSPDTTDTYGADIPLRFTVKEYAQGDTVGNFQVVKALLRVGRLLVVSALMPAGAVDPAVTTESHFLLLYDLNAFLTAPAGSMPPILSYHRSNVPVNAMKLDPHGRIIAVEGKVGSPGAVGLYEIVRTAGPSPTYQLFRRGAAQLSVGEENAVPLDLEIHSDDDSHSYPFSPVFPSAGHPFLPIEGLPQPDGNGFYALTLTLPNPLLPGPIGKNSRVTVVNKTLQMRWSKDPQRSPTDTTACDTDSGCAVSFAGERILVRPGDELLVLVNQSLFAFVPVLNKGLVVADLWKVDLGVQSPDFDFLYISPRHGWNYPCHHSPENPLYPSDPFVSAKFIEKAVLERTVVENQQTIRKKELYLSVTAGSYEGFFRVRPGSAEVLERLTDFAPSCLTGYSGNMTDLITVACEDNTARALLSINGARTGLLSFRMEPNRLDWLQTFNAGLSGDPAFNEIYDELEYPTGSGASKPYYAAQAFDAALPSGLAKLAYDPVSRLLYGVLVSGDVAVFDASGLCERGTVELISLIRRDEDAGTGVGGLASISPLVLAEAGLFFGAASGGCTIDPTTGGCVDGETVSGGITSVRVHGPVLTAVSPGDDGQSFHALQNVVPLGIKRPVVEGVEQGDAAFRVQGFLLEDVPAIRAKVEAVNTLGEAVSPSGPGFPVAAVELPLAKLVPSLDQGATSDLRQDANFLYATREAVVATADPRTQRDYAAPYNACGSGFNCVQPAWVAGSDPENPIPYHEIASGDYLKMTVAADDPAVYAGLMMNKGEALNTLPSVRMEMIDSPRPEPANDPALAAEGILLHSGEFSAGAVDLTVKGRGLDFVFTRTYDGQSIQHGPLGRGWDHVYNQRLRFLPDGDVEYYDGAGRVHRFQHAPNPELQTPAYFPPSGVFLELQPDVNGKSWGIRDPQNNLLLFNKAGRLAQIWDRNAVGEGSGNRIRLIYDLRERLIAVKDDLGRLYRLDYYPDTADAGAGGAYPGLLHTLTDFGGRTVAYAYNQNANLIEVTGPGAEVCDASGACADQPVLLARYTYEDLAGDTATLLNRTSNLLSVQNGNGETIVENTSIGGTGDQVLAQKVGDAAVILDGLMGVGAEGNGEVTITVQRDDATALITRYLLEGKCIKELYEPGMAVPTTFTYNSDGLLATTTKPEGNATRFTYAGDALRDVSPILSRANLLSVSEIPKPQSGADAVITSFSYRNNHLVESKVESAGVLSRWTGIERDPRGNPTAVTECAPASGTSCKPGEPNASSTAMTWDGYGRLTTHTDAGGRTTTYQYDGQAAGYLSQKMEQEGDKTYITGYATDARGNVTEITPPRARDYPTTYDYDALDRVQSELRTDGGPQSPFRSETRYNYDAAGNLVARETFGGLTETGEIWNRTTMAYDALGALTARASHYRDAGAEKRNITQYSYDRLHNLTRIESLAADGAGGLVPVGPVTTYAYDPRNLLSGQTIANRDSQNPVALHWGYGYTDNGLRATVTNPRGKVYTTFYDGLDRPQSTLDPSGVKSESILAADGTLTDQKTWQGSDLLAWTHYAYNDPLRRLTDTCQKLFTYPYNAQQATDVCTHSEYYPDGKVRYETGALGLRTENLYTQRGLTDQVIQAVPDGQGGFSPVVRTAYEYDANGVKTAEVVTEYDQGAPVGSYRTEYAYDQFGRLETVTDPLGHPTRYAYDARGNKVRETDPEGSFVQYQYDDLNRMTKKIEQTGGETTFSYTPLGQTGTITDANGHVTKYEYDDLNRPTKTDYAYGTPEQVAWENEYDAYGNLWRVHDPNGNVIGSAYDDRERLIGRTVIASAPGLVGPATESYAYDALSRMTTASNPEVSVAYTYDSLGRKLTEAYTIPELNQTFPITKAYDAAGNRTKTLYPSDRDIRRDYDPLGRLRHVTDYSSGLRQLAQYDYKGLQPDRVLYGTSQVPVVSTAFAYDPERKLLSQHTFNPNIQTPASGFGLPASGLDYGWTTGDRRRFRAKPQQNGLGNVFKYDRMSRVVEERIGVPDAALAGHNVPNAAPLEVAPAAGLLSYAMDPVYNFTSVTGYQNGLNDRRQYSTNARNQVTQAGNVMVEWDANGNMTSKSNGYAFKYDFNNRLREAVNPGGLNITYAYDPFNRRVLKKTLSTVYGLQTTAFVWDDQEVVEEYTKADAGSLQLSKQYVPAQSIDQKISANADLNGDEVLEAEYFYLQDQLGNVEAIVDNQGNKLEEYDHRGYGTTTIYAPDSTAPQVEQIRTLADCKLTLLFTEPVYPDTISADNLKVLDSSNAPQSGTWSLSSDKRSATFDSSLSNDAAYTVNVSSVRDLALNPMAPYTKGFTMAANAVLDDTKAPEIERIWQSEGNVFVSLTEDLAAAGVAADAVQIVRNALPATGTATLADPRTIQFTPDQPLIPDASYSLSIASAVTDLTLQPSAFQPVAFDFTPLPVAFYTRGDQRQERSTSAYKNFHLFQGREDEPETELIYVRARWLDPALGNWITQDPMKYVNGVYNLYNTISRDPMNLIDPRGLWEMDIHFYATYYLALKAGFTISHAEDIAWASQYVDDSPYTNPGAMKSVQPWFRRRIAAFHFPAPRGRRVELNSRYARYAADEAIVSKSIMRFGISLHTLADTFSHAGFSIYHDPEINTRPESELFNTLLYAPPIPLGHSEAGITPDMPYLHLENVKNACKEMFLELKIFAQMLYKGAPEYIEFQSFETDLTNVLSKKLPALEMRVQEWERFLGHSGVGGYVPRYSPNLMMPGREDWENYAKQHYAYIDNLFEIY